MFLFLVYRDDKIILEALNLPMMIGHDIVLLGFSITVLEIIVHTVTYYSTWFKKPISPFYDIVEKMEMSLDHLLLHMLSS